jgi:hypothetical protein
MGAEHPRRRPMCRRRYARPPAFRRRTRQAPKNTRDSGAKERLLGASPRGIRRAALPYPVAPCRAYARERKAAACANAQTQTSKRRTPFKLASLRALNSVARSDGPAGGLLSFPPGDAKMQMKLLWMMSCVLFSSGVFAGDCITNLRGQTVCGNDGKAVAVNPNKGTVTTAQKNASGVTTAQNSNGAKAAYNPHTGNAAVSQKNQNGVTTAQTSQGGRAKTKNGMGAAQGPNGTTCARGVNNQGCKKQ